jgi:hypothetical protein
MLHEALGFLWWLVTVTKRCSHAFMLVTAFGCHMAILHWRATGMPHEFACLRVAIRYNVAFMRDFYHAFVDLDSSEGPQLQ